MEQIGEAKAWWLNALGVTLALYLFMADAISAAKQGPEAVRNVLPTVFHWGWFSVALGLMSAPVWVAARRVLLGRTPVETGLGADTLMRGAVGTRRPTGI